MSFFNKLKDFKDKPTNKLKEEILNAFFQKPKKHKDFIKEYESVFDIRPIALYWILPVSLKREIELEGYSIEIEHNQHKLSVNGELLVFLLSENEPAYFYLYHKKKEIFCYTHFIVLKEHIYDSPHSVRFIMQEELTIEKDRLDKIAKLIVEWNKNIPYKYQLSKLYLSATESLNGAYYETYDQVSINIGSFQEEAEDIVLIHELSHKEFNWRLKEIMDFEEEKGEIYVEMSAKFDRIIDREYSYINRKASGKDLIASYLAEGAFWQEHYQLGHPQDNISELFASYKNIKFWKPQELEFHLIKLKVLSKEAWIDILELLILIDEFCMS